MLGPIHKFGTSVPRNFKFGIQIYLGMSHLTDDKLPHRGVVGSICVQNLMFLALAVTKLGRGSQNLKIWPKIPTTPLLRYFVILEMENTKIYPYTKFEVSSLSHSKFREGPKIQTFGPRPHDSTGVFCYPWAGKCLILSIYQSWSIYVFRLNLGMGSQNSKFCPRLPWPHFGGYFVIHELGHAKIYQCTTFEVSSFTISTFMAGRGKI